MAQEPVIHPDRVPRPAPKRDAVLRLLDGRRTARQIGDELGMTQKQVRALVYACGLPHLLHPASGTPIAASLPPDLVLRDLRLPPDVARWLIAQTENGALIQDVIRGALTDAYQEETGL